MNRFLFTCLRLVNRHGIESKVIQVQEGAYDPETLTTTNTEVQRTAVLFKNHLKATQYNYPNLVGKDAAEFYLANNNLGFKPEVKDKIVYGSDTYTIDAIKENWAAGELCLYQLIAVRN